MPFFSIITVCYNEISNIKNTLDSIIRQTSNNYELIVVDGGSTDGTKEVIQQYEKHIAWWCSEPDKGIYNAMNKGVCHATGEYVIFMNAGDWFYDDCVLEHVYKSGMSTDIIEGYVANTANGKKVKERYDDIYVHLFADTLSHQGTFIRRSLLQVHPYDEKYKIVADWKFWIETIILGKASYSFIEQNIAYYDMTGVSACREAVWSEREAVCQELFSPHVVQLIHSYYAAYDLALVKYAVFLNQHSHRGYELVRKIAKRVVKLVKLRIAGYTFSKEQS